MGLSYLVLIGDLFPGIVGGSRNMWIMASALIIVPLSLVKKLDSLKYSSILGLFAIAYLVCLIVGAFLRDVVFTDNYTAIRGDVSWIRVYDFKGLISTFTIVIFAYTGSMNMFSIINELKDNSMTNINKVVSTTITISSFLFLAVGLCGYLTFGSNTLGNIMLNYDPNSAWTTTGKLCLGSMVILSFPLLLHPCRIAANNMVHWTIINYGKCADHQIARNQHTHVTSPITMVVEDEEDRLLLESDAGYNATTQALPLSLIHI